jgi:GT2 family glycosyltransferase
MADSATPWLTIVTVVKDDPEGFARTTESIAEQDHASVEWLVVDGSGDPHQVPDFLAASTATVARYEWQTPAGVYAAMNAGLDHASGAYIHFLNAGDTYFSSSSVSAFRSLVERDPTWLFGQVCFVSADGRRTTPPPFDYQAEKAGCFSRGRFPPHQGTVVRTSALRAVGGFDTSYRIVADYAALLRLAQESDPVITTSTIATFFEGGVSSTHWRESLKEFHRARREILRPTGAAAARERLATAVQFTKMQSARLLGRVAS